MPGQPVGPVDHSSWNRTSRCSHHGDGDPAHLAAHHDPRQPNRRLDSSDAWRSVREPVARCSGQTLTSGVTYPGSPAARWRWPRHGGSGATSALLLVLSGISAEGQLGPAGMTYSCSLDPARRTRPAAIKRSRVQRHSSGQVLPARRQTPCLQALRGSAKFGGSPGASWIYVAQVETGAHSALNSGLRHD